MSSASTLPAPALDSEDCSPIPAPPPVPRRYDYPTEAIPDEIWRASVEQRFGEVVDLLKRIDERLEQIERDSKGAREAAERVASDGIERATRCAHHEARIERLEDKTRHAPPPAE